MKHLVLLHGWGATGAVWRRQVKAFEGACTVHAPTFPRWEAAWVAECLSRFPLRETVVLGWSLGGMLLLEALADAGLWPAGLVLVGVPAVFCQRAYHPHGQPPRVVRAMRQALKQDARRVLADFAAHCLAPGEEVFLDEAETLFDPGRAAQNLAQGLDYLLKADLRPLLPKLRLAPVIVQGGADRIVPPEQARFLSEQLPGSCLVMLPGAGHVPFITQAARFNEIVKEIVGGGAG
jgi:pimeloyl-[acyl-carrier protein] methyl ester esterase